jgi:hypothetical protein
MDLDAISIREAVAASLVFADREPELLVMAE